MKLNRAGIDGEVKIMRNAPMIALAFLVASFGAFETPTASAQTKTCTLVLNVVTHKDDQISPVDDARATALNTRNRKSTAAVFFLGDLRFFELRDGEYRIAVTRAGFKRAIHPMSFKCELMDAEAMMKVELVRGNFRRSVVASPQSVVANSQSGMPPIRRAVTVVLGSDNATALGPGVQPAAPPGPPPTTLPRAPISGGVLNGKAISLPKPDYPPIARQAGASGTVVVQVVIDEEGNVISTRAVSGHPLLQAACVEAARGAKFSPTKLAGQPVKVTGVITYNFIAE